MYKQNQVIAEQVKAMPSGAAGATSAKALASQFASTEALKSAAAVEVPEYFGMKSLQSRIKQYATASGQSKLSDYLKMYEKDQAQQALNLSDDEDDDSIGDINRDSM